MFDGRVVPATFARVLVIAAVHGGDYELAVIIIIVIVVVVAVGSSIKKKK